MKSFLLILMLMLAVSASAQTEVRQTQVEDFFSLDDLLASAVKKNPEILAAQSAPPAAGIDRGFRREAHEYARLVRRAVTPPGYDCQVHHVDHWQHGGPTNIDKLTFSCRSHHPLITPGGWTTRNAPTAPPNGFPTTAGHRRTHHQRLLPPERYLRRKDDDTADG